MKRLSAESSVWLGWELEVARVEVGLEAVVAVVELVLVFLGFGELDLLKFVFAFWVCFGFESEEWFGCQFCLLVGLFFVLLLFSFELLLPSLSVGFAVVYLVYLLSFLSSFLA